MGILGIGLSLFVYCWAYRYTVLLLASFLLGTSGGMAESPASVLVSSLSGARRGLAPNLSQVAFSSGSSSAQLSLSYRHGLVGEYYTVVE